MALSDESGNMVMPVSPMYGGGNGGFGSGFGDNGWWIILLFIILGGWGNGFGGYGNGGGVGFVDNSVQRGFDQAAIMNGITGVQSAVTSGFGDVATALCGGFAGVNAGIANGFAQAEIANNARAMSDMQQMFSLQSQLASCCCENRLASADLKYTIATENCADRAVISDGIRDVIDAGRQNSQAIMDKLCALELDSKNDRINELERQLTMANLAASQNAQTAAILANNEAQTTALEQYLAPVPRPAYVVQNPNCCANNCGTNCGCGF